ncbi:unnamed protein product [Aphanomyces euteiches]|uniref:Uncharacterized protein n=1 Tax=Aphanomyces euteiches TaxID=100861 RepID=A0A6G0XK81_9STRA|nr:hypothetical protein Ae201684_003860 [Aphanomyces euteiches]KAH9084832.1 hypothetical protein Ae201684P_002071 [Aphanomyces euteiches]
MLRSNQAKYSTFGAASEAVHPRDEASWFSRVFLTWCVPLVRIQRQLNIDDIWALKDINKVETNYKILAASFERTNSVFRAGMDAYGGAYLFTGLMGFLVRILDLVGPIVLQKVVDSTGDLNQMYIWLGGLLLAKVMRAIIWSHYVLYQETLGVRFMGGLKGLLFQKLLSKASYEQKDVPDLANAYSADMETLFWASISLNNLWILPTQVIVVSYMLYQQIGVSAFAGMGVIVLSLILGSIVATIQSKSYDNVSAARDQRMQAVKETFGSILVVKLQAWEAKCYEKIKKLRDIELGHIWRLLLGGVASIFILWATPLFVSMSSFAVYTMVMDQQLTATKVFSALALFRLLQNPVREIPDNISAVVQARVSLNRILSYLTQEDKPVRPEAPAPEDQNVLVTIQNGTFTWGDESTPILKDVNLTIHRGDLVVIHGKVGSGKSSLCMAICGEMKQTQGTSGVYGSIAYCSQEPWIQQMSVRDNILFGKPFDSAKYTRVVDACGLLPDFELMAFGDMTEVGSKGRNLSGGQKARVSLARACYSDADIVILDAPLAAIDAVVQKEIMTKCIESLLKSKTVILVTHNADIIGAESVNRLVELNDGIAIQTVANPSDNSIRGQSGTSEKPHTLSGSLYSPRHIEMQSKWHQHFEVAMAEETSEEDRAEGRVNGSVYSSYISASGGAWTVFWLCIIQTLWQGFQIASDVWLGQWTASSDAAERTNWYISIYSALCLASVVMVLFRTLVIASCGLKAARFLFENMTSSLLGTTLTFFDNNPIGRIINRYGEDTASIDTRLSFTFGSFVAVFFALSGALLTSAAAIKWASLLFLPIGYLYVRLSLMYLQPSRELSRLNNVTNSPVLSFLDEVEQGFMLLRAYGKTHLNQAIDRHAHHVDLNNQMWFARAVVNMWFELCIQIQGTAIVMIVATGLVLFRSTFSAGMVGLAFNYVLMADANIVDLVNIYSYIEIGMVSPERVLQYSNLENEEQTLAKKATFNLTQGSINFNHVQFRYKPTGELVLKDLTCSIQGGQKIGIVGRTGAGKSSLTMVLFHMYPIESGSISIDGRDISTIAKQELRQQLSIIPQSPVLFKGTLRQYLDPFGSFDDAALWSVVSKAGLHTLVSEMPDKLSTELADKGSNLSVGERQMLCLARALLVQSKIVVLDEATAAMDHETDVKLQRVIAEEFADATVLTIAHRLHTIMNSDRIMVMDAGCVVEMDSPANLLAQEDGVFYRLAKDGGVLDE